MLNCQVLTKKITSNKSKHLLVENELKKLKLFDSSYFIGKKSFQPMYRYFKIIADVGDGRYIYYWKSNGLSDETINSITMSYYSVTPFLDYYGTKTRVEFSQSCLKQDSGTFNHKK